MGALNQPGFYLYCCALGRPSSSMACLINLRFLKVFSQVVRPLWGYDSSSQVCLCVYVRLQKLTVIQTCLICVLCAVHSTIQCLSLSSKHRGPQHVPDKVQVTVGPFSVWQPRTLCQVYAHGA